jgi:hypothetical protein
MDMQAIDLELLDLEVSDNRSPDRKPADGQGADSTGANSRCTDRGRAKASRSNLHRGRLLAARTEPGKGPREGSPVVHECSSFAQQEPGHHVVGLPELVSPTAPLASQDGQTDTMVVTRRHRLPLLGPVNISIEVWGWARAWGGSPRRPEGARYGWIGSLERAQASAIVACRRAP